METQTFGLLWEWLNLFLWIGWILLFCLIYFIVTYNSIINSKNNVKESFWSIDTVLQNRYNLIPNLVEVVKQYMQHESWVISKVTELRASLMSNSNKTSSERFEKENQNRWPPQYGEFFQIRQGDCFCPWLCTHAWDCSPRY